MTPQKFDDWENRFYISLLLTLYEINVKQNVPGKTALGTVQTLNQNGTDIEQTQDVRDKVGIQNS